MTRACPQSEIGGRNRSCSFFLLLILLIASASTLAVANPSGDAAAPAAVETPRASLTVRTDAGDPVEMPLRKTLVRAEISGFVARVRVEQVFVNPLDVAIEARYVFPLPERSAVDGFVMTIGERRIQGEIRRREEAAAIYREARHAGHATALLEQERPNIFTQSVANIPSGGEIRVELSYVDFLVYEKGRYRFNFPMVVGPRYVPGTTMAAKQAGGDAVAAHSARRIVDPRAVHEEPPVDRVRDAARISPPVLRPGYVPSNTVDLEVRVDTGTPLRSAGSESHEIVVNRRGASGAVVRLARRDVIPNADFILNLDVAPDEPELGLLAHRSDGDGFFALRLQPPAEISAEEATPKEIIFVVDVSGSMSGVPIEMSRRLMKRALDTLGPSDTFNIVLFSSSPSPLATRSLPSTQENLARGRKFVSEVAVGGGTEMREALRAAFALPEDPSRLRMVLLLTDGYVGNEMELFGITRAMKHGARVFCLGVGTSVNHYLLRELADIGRGAYAYVRPDGNAAAAVDRFNDWVTRPFLTDLEIDWGSLPVEDVRPERLPDLHSGQTLTVVGRYLWEGRDTVVVRGRIGGRPWESSLDVELPEKSSSHQALGSVWARERIRELTVGATSETTHSIEMEVTSLALAFRLMSNYTSFVAVDSAEISNPGEAPVLWEQALAMPEYVSFTACFGPSGPGSRPVLAAPAVDAGTKTPATFNTEFIEALPVIGRSYEDLLTVTPGATDTEGDGNPNVQGSRDTGLALRLAGGAPGGVAGGITSSKVSDPATGTFGPNVNIDAIEEIEVVASGAAASYGRADGGFANIATVRGARAVAPDSGIEAFALRILADLADDGRLSRAQGLPALAALLEAQHADGRFSPHPRVNALATWALAECSKVEPEIPWVREALDRAASSLKASPGARTSTESADPAPAPGRPDPWTDLALAALWSCHARVPAAAGAGEPAGGTTEDHGARTDVRALLRGLKVGANESTARSIARILDEKLPGLRCLVVGTSSPARR